VSLKGVPCIGDALRDLEAASAVEAQPILVLTGKGKKTQEERLPPGTLVYADLGEAVKSLAQ
jgi:D-glycero-D-manno-heptose 1,7-bisphosphate phosphatase